MNTYYVFNTDQSWVQSGGYGDCFALAKSRCHEHPDDEVYLVRQRGGEKSARYVLAITKEKTCQVLPPKYVTSGEVRSLQNSLVRQSHAEI